MSKSVQITFDAHDPGAQSLFWAQVLDYVVPPPPGSGPDAAAEPLAAWRVFLQGLGVPESEWDARSAAEAADGNGPRLFFQRVPEDKVVKNRVHLDVRAAPGLDGDERMAALETEAARLVEIGARRVRRFDPDPPMESGFIVMADPEGNEFCLD